MPTIDATVGGANSNSYATMDEVDDYFDERIPLVPAWVPGGADPAKRLVITATRVLDALAQPFKVLVPAQGGVPAYYRVRRQWTGAKATATQRLAWPRTGMFDMNGNEIASDVIPEDLKFAMAEFAGQLAKSDTTLNNDVIVQGLTSLRAGPVSLTFKDNITPTVIPDLVYNLMPLSWLTDELYVPAMGAELDLVSTVENEWDTRRTTDI